MFLTLQSTTRQGTHIATRLCPMAAGRTTWQLFFLGVFDRKSPSSSKFIEKDDRNRDENALTVRSEMIGHPLNLSRRLLKYKKHKTYWKGRFRFGHSCTGRTRGPQIQSQVRPVRPKKIKRGPDFEPLKVFKKQCKSRFRAKKTSPSTPNIFDFFDPS